MLKLALAALERDVPNVDLARGVLRDVVGDGLAEDAARSKDSAIPDAGGAKGRRAVTIKQAAELLSMCPKTVRKKISRGEIPVIGAGRATRVLMPDAIDALAHEGKASRREMVGRADPIAEEAVAHVRNRARLRPLVGGKGDAGTPRTPS